MSLRLARSQDLRGYFAAPNYEKDLRVLQESGVIFVRAQALTATCFNPHCGATPFLVAKRGRFVTRCCNMPRCQVMAARHSETLYRSEYAPTPGYEPLRAIYASGFRRSDAPDLRPVRLRRTGLIGSSWLASLLPDLFSLQGNSDITNRH